MFPNLKKPQARDEKLAKCDKIFPIERNSERKMKNWLPPLFSSCTWPCGCKWTWQAGGLSICFFCLQSNSEACLGGTNRIWSPWFPLWSRLCSFHGRKKHFDALVGQPTYLSSTPYTFFQPWGESSSGGRKTKEFFPPPALWRGLVDLPTQLIYIFCIGT